jgi:hypothetical protein
LEGDEFLSGIEYWVELHRRIDRKKVCKEVPDSVAVAVVLPLKVERMFKPGAKTSTQAPWLEK